MAAPRPPAADTRLAPLPTNAAAFQKLESTSFAQPAALQGALAAVFAPGAFQWRSMGTRHSVLRFVCVSAGRPQSKKTPVDGQRDLGSQRTECTCYLTMRCLPDGSVVLYRHRLQHSAGCAFIARFA